MDNCYIVEYGKEKDICHFDEIAYFKIIYFDRTTAYFPILKSGEQMIGTNGEDGEKIMKKYFNYKNGL